jgi:hypothetical protein
MTACEECGFSYESLPVGEIAPAVRAFDERYRQAMSGATEDRARRRPRPEVWSAHEYCCHVRDVLLVLRDRAVVALVEDAPTFKRMHRDQRVALCHYADHDNAEALAQLGTAAHLCAMVYAGLDEVAWARPIDYFGNGGAQDLAWMGRHTVHEATHHLMDVVRVLAAPS